MKKITKVSIDKDILDKLLDCLYESRQYVFAVCRFLSDTTSLDFMSGFKLFNDIDSLVTDLSIKFGELS